ncbi:MAG TPA: VOC family protein [Ureibacillus sp.]|nr:VOC family protein [Ureibacillus sp.]
MYKLDHIVHFVDHPEVLVDRMSDEGVRTVLGGKHEMWGTYNSLSYFENLSYIEYIGIFDEELFNKSAKVPYTLHESYEKNNRRNGFTRIALRTNTINEDAKRLKEAGLFVDGPKSFSRKRPDGTIVSWKLLHFGLEGNELEFPFLIEWNLEDQERYNDLLRSGTLGHHPLGNLKIDSIVLTVKNLDKVRQWSNLFNFELIETTSLIKLVTPNCDLIFYYNRDAQNLITEVVISGASMEKTLKIDNANYKFIK